ncbi:hypothetical protein NMK71_05080 [Weeksellaceae bacterium KMM 9713]|uniref:Lysophospholipase L1 n=1 Tax=Profundicola chukchiensis TaxID=2961959 RepID=A0A9X4RVI0_9FLAO|nr:hypothetical protein [Profundicola chukchiensis]MDG4945780.1 hypothetical protein [Profundicola chukchiensis]
MEENKNRNYKVFALVVYCFIIYLIVSLVAQYYGTNWKPLANVNLVSDIFRAEVMSDSILINNPNIENDEIMAESIVMEENVIEEVIEEEVDDFNLYLEPHLITDFTRNSQQPAMPNFIKKLVELKNTKKGKIRIAYLGDSMIEGDLLTMTLRELLQDEFGGEGVGFVPIYSNIAGFRTTVTANSSGWKDDHFMNKSSKGFYISGHVFTGNGKASFNDRTIKNNQIPIEKSIIYGKVDNGKLNHNGTEKTLDGTEAVNKTVLANDTSTRLSISSKTAEMPLFGVSFESEDGIFIDNFSFRGSTGFELGKVNSQILNTIQSVNNYDLIVLQYGVNLLFRPKDTNYDYYQTGMQPVIEKLKKSFEGADFLLVSSADRAFRYNGEFKTAIGLPNLIKLQATMAKENEMAFYNQFASMGGENSIVDWASQKPSLANKDHVHPNHRGTRILANNLFNAILDDYKKFDNNKLEEN